MSSRLFVHLGPHKTATSSIQWWLDHHAEALARSGVRVGRAGRNDLGHHDLALGLLHDTTTGEVEPGHALGSWAELRREFGDLADDCSLVVSSENLAQLDEHHLARVAPLLQGLPTTLIVGIRDPMALVPSLWQETVKWGRHWDLSTASRELLHGEASGLLPLVDRWTRFVRPVDVVAFVVPGHRAGSAAVEAFAAAIGVPGSVVGELPPGINRSLSFAHVEAIRAVSTVIDPTLEGTVTLTIPPGTPSG